MSVCAGCGQRMGNIAKPKWVFTDDVRPLGLMHTGCAKAANPRNPGTDASIATEREAKFMAWTDLARRGEPRSAQEAAAVILPWAEHPSIEPGKLSPDQERWIERYGERRAEVQAAYDQLVRDFLEWEQGTAAERAR